MIIINVIQKKKLKEIIYKGKIVDTIFSILIIY